MSCKNCPYGNSYDSSSDFCDSCRNDPDPGWGGFTDHMLGKHFNSEEERSASEMDMEDFDSDEMDGGF